MVIHSYQVPLQGESAVIFTVYCMLWAGFVLKVFYGSIIIEGSELIPETGVPCIVCGNHSNSLTDALLLITSIPSKKRNMLRMTAKATQFGKRTFTSWLIESTGTVPIKRRQDHSDSEGNVDNTDVMEKLKETLEAGNAICLFPEGMSRYSPTISPLKTGVARIISEVLTRNKGNPDFEVSLLTCSVTYMHRQNFRSDVLVTFHEPMKFTPKNNPELVEPVDYDNIRALTAQMQQKISAGTIDSPSWELVRIAKLSTRLYAPLGTRMRLGDFVRITRAFIDYFNTTDGSDYPPPSSNDGKLSDRDKLRQDLKAYQDQLAKWGIKDDRIRRPLPRRTILMRIPIRLVWSLCLFTISLPGLVLWVPVFLTNLYAVRQLKSGGPVWNTHDEIAQYKLTFGLAAGLTVWALAVLLTLPFAVVTFFAVPALMWFTLRWLEDGVAAFRAYISLVRLLRVGKGTLLEMHSRRVDLHARVMGVACDEIGLPPQPEVYFMDHEKEKGRVTGGWDSSRQYFSVRRRRKRDWNETLRLYDQVDYPGDD